VRVTITIPQLKLMLSRSKSSEQLLSADIHSNTANYKFTYSVEIVPICKDDLVCIPPKQARQLGNINPLTICVRVGNSIQLLDPSTLNTCDITAPIYWRNPFGSLATVTDLMEFTVLDIEPDGRSRGKFVLADAQVAMSGAFRSSSTQKDDATMDYEHSIMNNQIFHTHTHLGGILQPGDTALGYHLGNANYNSDDFSALPSSRIPDVILVKKAYPNRRKKSKARNWRLRSIAKEAGEEGETSGARGVVGRMGGRDQKKVEEDYELFLRDLEEDPEMRSAVNLYKTPKDAKMDVAEDGAGIGRKTRKKQAHLAMDVDEPANAPPSAVTQENGEEGNDEVEEEPDFPEVRLDELLEGFDEMTLGESEDV
jgi:nonsense-mediated mRNA decay protein 3